MSTSKTEPLTDAMIRKLRDEAANAGDIATVRACSNALCWVGSPKRQVCADAINEARGMDDSREFVLVVVA